MDIYAHMHTYLANLNKLKLPEDNIVVKWLIITKHSSQAIMLEVDRNNQHVPIQVLEFLNVVAAVLLIAMLYHFYKLLSIHELHSNVVHVQYVNNAATSNY